MTEDYKIIYLNKGHETIVDASDYEWLNQWKWHVSSRGYAIRNVHSKENIQSHFVRMHRFIMNTPKGLSTDHINGNKLDNRRCNLRICNQSQNVANSKIWKREKSSKFKGVCFFKRDANWQSYIMIARKRIHLGYFQSETEAALAYNKKAIELYGKFSNLNEISV